MTIVCQTPFKTWMNSPDETEEDTFDYADELVIKIDQGKTRLLIDINGVLYQFPEVISSEPLKFVYKRNRTSRYNNCTLINNSDNVVDISYKTPYDGTTKVNMLPQDVYRFVAQSVTVAYKTGSITASWIASPVNGGIETIDWGKTDYDHNALSDIFNRYYAGWFIVDPDETGFRKVLQDQYDLHKEQIDRHYAYIRSMSIAPSQTEIYTFGAKSRSETKGARTDSTGYGARSGTDMTYDYPVNVSADDANASKAEKTSQTAVTDETTYGAQTNSSSDEQYVNSVERSTNDKPIAVLEDSDRLRTFYQYFIDCFRECFTLFETMTW
jgi:hypothetical protein